MSGRATVCALAAWAGPPDSPRAGGRRRIPEASAAPFRTAVFDDCHAAVSAGLLLLSTMPRLEDSTIVRVGLATGPADRAVADAGSLAALASPGSLMLTGAAVEDLGRRLPDGMALRAEVVGSGSARQTAFALRTAAEVVPHGLPHPSTRIVGRGTQLRALRALLEEERLITLTGSPGSGKTRLALELSRAVLGRFADGAWFVSLAPVQKPELIPHAVARALGMSEEGDRPMVEVVANHLAHRELLLILDNFEHLADGAPSVAAWLAAAPSLRVIGTSRAALHLTGEHEFVVPPLNMPADPADPDAGSSEAVRLFTERARAVVPDFDPDPDALADIARIALRLDGLPLALELAAVRAKALPVAAILARLEHSLELLTHRARDVPDRHRSLHAAVSWSYGLLSPSEQAFLRRLSVFRGGWSLEAAEAVTTETDALQLTTVLLDESLIRRQPDARTEPRYDMLATLREYARDRLVEAGEADETAERHATWYLELAERSAPLLTGSQRGDWLDRLEREHHNFRAAIRWALDRGRPEIALRLGAALWRFWQIRAHIGEGRQIMADLLAHAEAVEPSVRARALSAAGSLAYWQNDAAAAVGFYEASVELRRTLGEPTELASGLYDLGHAVSVLEPVRDSKRGRDLELEALEIYRGIGDEMGQAWLTWALGCNSHFAGAVDAAETELASSVDRFRSLDDPFGLAWALTMHGLAAAEKGEGDAARSSWQEALSIFADVDDVSGIGTVLEHLARLAATLGDPQRALRLAAASARVRGVSETGIVEIAYGSAGNALDELRLGPSEVAAARREGEAMSTAEAVAYAAGTDQASDERRLRVYALGAMRVELDGVSIRRWGGEKAGSRQAMAIFAFLFDRGLEGVAKDEATDLLWPELEIRRADLAFHRTLGGLRSVLDPPTPGGRQSVIHDGGRYRLDPDLVAWSDVATFETLIDGAAAMDGDRRLTALEDARRLWRGDYLDDCPFYGDSSHVEERRSYLRGRFEDLLVRLGDVYRERGDMTSAAADYRRALGVNPESDAARAGLERVGAIRDLEVV